MSQIIAWMSWMSLLLTAALGSCSRSPERLSGVGLAELTSAGLRYSVTNVDLREVDLQLMWKKPDGDRFDNFHSLDGFLRRSGRRLLFATNAGIFDPSFTPCGLYVESGRELTPLNLKRGVGNFYLEPNGVFFIGRAGARIVRSDQYVDDAQGVQLATQSGPMLVIDGTINSAFALDSKSRRVRSGIGIVSPDRVVFVLSRDAVTFHEFAEFFLASLNCSQALYLDGDISRFYDVDASPSQNDEHFAGMFAVVARR